MADTVKNFPQRLFKMTKVLCREVPSQVEVHRWVDRMVNLLFPVRDKRNTPLYEIEAEWSRLQDDLLRIVTPLCPDADSPCCDLTARFFGAIPLIYTGLMQDAKIYQRCDPAAFCREEVILCYPGFYAVAVYRLAHELYKLQVPILPRVISEYAHSQTGIDINPGATIGPRFYIDHGTGVVIGETCVIGRNVKLYQGVTLGAKFVDKELQGVRRHPKIEDNVIIYAGSTILGGDTVIGHDTVVGGNVWLTESVPPHSTVYHQPEISINGPRRK
ncbi:MAG: serine acetyltransferase [Rikenellaceae bacterium]|nr:serine acetyltransferase [Rikenellaceae bacterium]